MGYMSDKEVLRRSHWSQKKRAKKAAEAVGLMVYEGEIKKLWRDFHIDLRSARESIVCSFYQNLTFVLFIGYRLISI